MQSEKISKLLNELREYTGVSLSFDETATFADNEQTINVLEGMLEPYKKKTAQAVFWSSLLEGSISDADYISGLSEYHLSDDMIVVVYVINFPDGYDDTTLTMLHDLCDDYDRIITNDGYSLVLLHMSPQVVSEYQISEYAANLLDTLSAEAMVKLHIAYDGTLTPLSDITTAYRHASLAMLIGLKFLSQKNLHCYHELGLEKIVYRLSEEDCREFISNHLKGFSFNSLSAELSSTIYTFFESGLSVTETSKNLFIHRNTLLYRLDKFQSLSGLDLRKFDDAVTAKIAMLMELRLSGS